MTKSKPTEQEVAQYRAALAALMARCLQRVRATQVPVDTPPLLVPKRHD